MSIRDIKYKLGKTAISVSDSRLLVCIQDEENSPKTEQKVSCVGKSLLSRAWACSIWSKRRWTRLGNHVPEFIVIQLSLHIANSKCSELCQVFPWQSMGNTGWMGSHPKHFYNERFRATMFSVHRGFSDLLEYRWHLVSEFQFCSSEKFSLAKGKDLHGKTEED